MMVAAITPAGQPAWSRTATIGTYGGATDKVAAGAEATPYAAIWYREYGGMLGSAFSTAMSGEVHARKFALARVAGAVSRATEALTANASPRGASMALDDWAAILRTELFPDDSRQDIRQRTASRLVTSRSNARADIDEAVSRLLGSWFVRNWWSFGVDLATPPTPTYWAGVNPGPSSHDLGGGAWLSRRAHLTVEVKHPGDTGNEQFLRLVNVELFRLLDDALPATMTFNWATNLTTGFQLDISQLDFVGLT